MLLIVVIGVLNEVFRADANIPATTFTPVPTTTSACDCSTIHAMENTINKISSDNQNLNAKVSFLENTLTRLKIDGTDDHQLFRDKIQVLVDKTRGLEVALDALKTENQGLKTSLSGVLLNVNTLKEDLRSQLKNQTTNINHVVTRNITISGTGYGATFTRWSRNDCPNNTELIYKGYVGGGNYGHIGSAVEPLCLPLDPDFTGTTKLSYAFVYGAEFYSNHFASDSQYQNLPCAVCRAPLASNVIMIPGKNMCYPGWNQEYNGYLSTNNHALPAAGTYVCIDSQPEYVPGGEKWNGQSKVFYGVTAKCGSLDCPPYKEGYSLTCVVCSK